MKRALSLILALVLCIGLFAGCGGTDKGSVYWLNFKPESDEVLQEIAKMYKEEHDIAMEQLKCAKDKYNAALRVLNDERKRYEKEMERLFKLVK